MPDPTGHGGCGHVQPVIRKEGLKLFVVYKKGKDEDEVSLGCSVAGGRKGNFSPRSRTIADRFYLHPTFAPIPSFAVDSPGQ
jgi:hypothetical protein